MVQPRRRPRTARADWSSSCRGSDGALWHLWQEGSGAGGGRRTGSPRQRRRASQLRPGLALNGEGLARASSCRATTSASGTSGRSSGAGWWSKDCSSRGSAGGGFVGAPALALNGEGRLELFVRGKDGALWHIWQAAAGRPVVEGLGLPGKAPAAASPARQALALNGDGRLELFVRGKDGPSGTSGRSSGAGSGRRPGPPTAAPAAASPAPCAGLERRRPAGALRAGQRRALWHIWQEPGAGCGRTWAPPRQRRRWLRRRACLALNAAAGWSSSCGATTRPRHIWQERAGRPWSAWASRRQRRRWLRRCPGAFALNGDGRLELFVRGKDGPSGISGRSGRRVVGMALPLRIRPTIDIRTGRRQSHPGQGQESDHRGGSSIACSTSAFSMAMASSSWTLMKKSLADQAQPIEKTQEAPRELVASP